MSGAEYKVIIRHEKEGKVCNADKMKTGMINQKKKVVGGLKFPGRVRKSPEMDQPI